MILSIDGQKVTCMKDVVALLQSQESEYADILTVNGTRIVLKKEGCVKANEAIRARYKIESDRSADLRDSVVVASQVNDDAISQYEMGAIP